MLQRYNDLSNRYDLPITLFGAAMGWELVGDLTHGSICVLAYTVAFFAAARSVLVAQQIRSRA